MKEEKKESPIGVLWGWSKPYHGKFIGSVILAVLGVACQMVPYAEYRKTKSEMQDWLVAQKIVQEILKEDEQKKEQLHEQEVRQEEENRQSSR